MLVQYESFVSLAWLKHSTEPLAKDDIEASEISPSKNLFMINPC
tara:strand:+ start:280 stop:411 length:132 start_codon:yes stop_codon:yes gene_type:complete